MEMKTKVVRARVGPTIKKRAEKVLAEIGISPSEAINVFYKRIAVEGAIPFSLKVPNVTSRRAIADTQNGKVREFKNFDEFAAHIRTL